MDVISGEDLKELEEQPAELAQLLRRAPTYRAFAKEIGWMAFNLALWPFGLVDEAVHLGFMRLRPKSNGRLKGKPSSDAAEIPIILIHGYFHNRSGLMVMRRALRRHGFRNVEFFSYNPFRKGIPEIAESLAHRIERLSEQSGCKKVHLVGHSLGGLIARWYVEQAGGSSKVHTVVTLGTPHSGTFLAHAGRSPVTRQMRRGSDLLKQMAQKPLPKSVRYLSYYSDLDVLVKPSRSACLENGDGKNVRNILVHDLGHMSLLISPELIESIAGNLSD
jgi:triacylglycerol lipase